MSSYIIWNPSSKLPPTVVHPTRAAAILIAGRMAVNQPGEKFYVCKLTNSAVLPPPTQIEYSDLDPGNKGASK